MNTFALAGTAMPRPPDYPLLGEPDLVSLARRGDERAIRLLIRQHNQRLFRAARSIVGNDVEAEDVVQASYARAFTHLDGFRGDASMATWLTRITVNEALGRLRRRRPIESLDLLDDNAPALRSSAPGPEEETARHEVARLVGQMVDRLGPAFRSVFVLREVEGLSTEETAALLEIPAETVKSRLHRARRELRAQFGAQLSGSFANLYPFDGARCALMADRVLEQIRRS